MKRKTILILGDSTSMSIGIERQMYPFHLAAMKIWAAGTKIINCSLPGFTSADACAFFFKNKKYMEPIAALIIYLGNCDAVSSELRKGQYSVFHEFINKVNPIYNKKRTKARLRNRLLHFEWNNNYDDTIETPESPKDYSYNISRIVSASEKLEIPVILIRPEANVLFPAGVGKGNFIFYKYLGVRDRISERIVIEDQRFKEALRLHEGGELDHAMEAYKTIFLKSGPLSLNLEYQSIVVNNYAVCAAESNAFDEAEYLLNLLLKERGARKEIILYNLAQISRLRGNLEEYRRRLVETYEADKSMYRIREPYRRVIDKISARYRNVRIIDFASFVTDYDYVDHCHPAPKAQVLIARHIADKLRTAELEGEQPLEIENRLYNPEYALGNTADFHSYFKTFAAFSSDEIRNRIAMLKVSFAGKEVSACDQDSLLGKIPSELSTAFSYYLKHPCFPKVQDIFIACPYLPSDVGRFPEYFLFRYLIPYLSTVEKTEELLRLFSPQVGLLRRSEEFVSILPESIVHSIEANESFFNLEYERVRLPAILQKVSLMFLKHLKQGNQIYERLKTTIYWYFRETLRFGAHSRISMRYERVMLEFMAEALAVAAVLDFRMGSKMQFEIRSLIGWLEEATQIHEYFCREFSLARDDRTLLAQYDSKLMDIARKIEASSWLFPTDQKAERGKCLS